MAGFGYDVEWESIPASAVGAPHRRDRIFIVANSMCDGLETNSDEAVVFSQANGDNLPRHISSMGSSRVWDSARPIGAVPMGVGDGLPFAVDRLRSLGNAVVPQVAEWIGRQIANRDMMDR